jgi:hypothetical protein
MTMQTEHHDQGWANSFGAQVTLAIVAIVAVIAIAWFTVF